MGETMINDIYKTTSEIQDALGIKGDDVTSFTLNFAYGELPEVVVRHMIKDSAGLSQLIAKKYKLVPITEMMPCVRGDCGFERIEQAAE
jgi:hypothetical protein